MGLFLVRVLGFTVWIYTAACEEICSQHRVQGILQGLPVCSSCALSPTACYQPTKAWVSTSNISVVHVHHEVCLLYRGFCTGTTFPPKGLQVLTSTPARAAYGILQLSQGDKQKARMSPCFEAQ